MSRANLHEDHLTVMSPFAGLFVGLEMFQINAVEKSKYTIMFDNFLKKLCRLWDNEKKYCTAGPTTDDNMAQAHCMLDK
jgi:hypothetical protein